MVDVDLPVVSEAVLGAEQIVLLTVTRDSNRRTKRRGLKVP